MSAVGTSTTPVTRRGNWLSEAIRRVDADANRSADTHLHVFPMPDRVRRRPVPQGRVRPSDRVAEASARPLAVPLRAVQRLDHGGDDRGRGVERLDCGERGVLRPPARSAVRRRDAGVDEQGEGRAHRVLRRTVPLRRAGRRRCTRRGRAGSPPRSAGTTSTSSRYAERATDWRGNNNIAESIFGQVALDERIPDPDVDRGRRRHGRHLGHHRPLRAVPASSDAPGGRRPGELGVPPRL